MRIPHPNLNLKKYYFHSWHGLFQDELSKYSKKIHFILGFVDDKDLSKIIPSLPIASSYSFIKPNVIRGMKSEKAREIFESYGIQGTSFIDLQSAINQRLKNVSKNELIFVGGSNFIIADLLKLKENKQLPF